MKLFDENTTIAVDYDDLIMLSAVLKTGLEHYESFVANGLKSFQDDVDRSKRMIQTIETAIDTYFD